MPTNGLLIVFLTGDISGFNYYSSTIDLEKSVVILSSIFVATSVLPLIVALILKKLKLISSLHMEKKEERVLPFLLTTIFYISVISLLLFYRIIPTHGLLISFMKGATLSLLAGMIITSSWKISIHMIGIGGVLGTIILLSKFRETDHFNMISAIVLIAGLIGFSRLTLKAHNENQLLAGFLLGLTCQLLPILIG